MRVAFRALRRSMRPAAAAHVAARRLSTLSRAVAAAVPSSSLLRSGTSSGVAVCSALAALPFAARALSSSAKASGETVVKTASGLEYVDRVVGSGDGGRRPRRGDTIRVHYTGTLDDGSVFDSSVSRGEPIEFQVGVGQVIRGWDEGLMSMGVGGKRKLLIPAALGYGNRAAGPIPAGSRLTFEVELVEIVTPPAGATVEGKKLEGKQVVTTASGLQYVDEQVGTGALAERGKQVSVHYTGRLETGRKFDSSKDRNEPFAFRLGAREVIAGWDEGVAGMRVGGKRLLVVPPELGYGSRGIGPIPGGATLYFDVELLKV